MAFIVHPTKWEAEHAAGIFAGMEYQAEHHGELPDTPVWRMLERRDIINPVRFARNHPNIAMILARRDDWPTCEPTFPVLPPAPCDEVETPIVGVPTPHKPAAVPEPSALDVALIAIGVLALVKLAKTFNACRRDFLAGWQADRDELDRWRRREAQKNN